MFGQIDAPGYPRTVQTVIQIEADYTRLLGVSLSQLSATEYRIRPTHPGEVPPVKVGDQICIKFWDKGALCRWEAEITEVGSDIGIRLLSDPRRERRLHPRVSVEVPISFVVVESTQIDLIGQMGLNCKTQDLSVGGAGFTTRVTLQVGDSLISKIDLPDGQITVVGSVERSEIDSTREQVLIGLQFRQSEAEDQQRLQQFLSRFPV